MSEPEPTEATGRLRITERLPATLHVAFWILIAAAAATVFFNGRNLIGFDAASYIANMHRIEASKRLLSDSDVLSVFVTVLVFVAFLATAEVILAILIRRGRGWARVVVTVLMGLAVVQIVAQRPAGTTFVIAFFVAAAALVTVWLLWLPPSNRYFRAVRAARMQTRRRAIPPAMPAHPAAWVSDPSGRHQFRYWDGGRWTDYVGDNGAEAVDPL
jgi:uncharacterized protein DUF2510